MALRRAARLVGTFLLVAGTIILLFVAYQLWGTSITTRLHQEQLRRQFDQELAVAHHHGHANPTTTSVPSVTTTTTQPISGLTYPVPGDVPPEGQPIGIIDIPAIGANYVVVEGTSTGDLMLGPGHYAGTALPGQPGNAAIAGHRTTYLHPFYSLDQVAPGDPIYVTTTQGRFEYMVTRVFIVAPTDIAVVDPTTTPELTLTTCTPRYSASERLVVRADLVSPPAPVPFRKPISGHRPSGRAAASQLAGLDGSAWGAIGWAAGCLVVAGVVWALRRRRLRIAVAAPMYVFGTLALLVLLFFFFESISPLLPASF